MKKLFLLLVIGAFLLPGCTSQEEDFAPLATPEINQIEAPDGETEEDPEEDPIPPPVGD